MRKVSKSTAGAMRNANAMYGQKGGGAYSRAANRAVKGGKSGMSVHRAGMSGAGLS